MFVCTNEFVATPPNSNIIVDRLESIEPFSPFGLGRAIVKHHMQATVPIDVATDAALHVVRPLAVLLFIAVVVVAVVRYGDGGFR